jgi:hypothetical protein
VVRGSWFSGRWRFVFILGVGDILNPDTIRINYQLIHDNVFASQGDTGIPFDL